VSVCYIAAEDGCGAMNRSRPQQQQQQPQQPLAGDGI